MKTILITKELEKRIEARDNASALFGRVCRDYDGWVAWSGSEGCQMVHKKAVAGKGPKTRFVRGAIVIADEEKIPV